VHDHAWDLRSYVLVGRMVHTEFSWAPATARDPGDWEMWEVAGGDRPGMGGTSIRPTGRLGRMVPVKTLYVDAGEWYSFPRFRFHLSRPEGVTATHMVKYNRAPNAEPHVAARVGQTPDRAATEPRYVGTQEDLLWRVIEEALS